MRKQLLHVLCWISLSITAGFPAMGAPSGLNLIPTADVLDKGVISLELETDGKGQPWGSASDRNTFSLFQYGIGNGIELGVDQCLNDPDTWVNAKWRMRDESAGLPAVAIGVQGISKGERAQPYVAVLKSIGDTRLHAGTILIDGKTRWMLGLDHPLGNRVTLQTDYISGGENSFTYGIAVSLSKSLSLTLAGSSGNATETGNGHIVNLAWAIFLK